MEVGRAFVVGLRGPFTGRSLLGQIADQPTPLAGAVKAAVPRFMTRSQTDLLAGVRATLPGVDGFAAGLKRVAATLEVPARRTVALGQLLTGALAQCGSVRIAQVVAGALLRPLRDLAAILGRALVAKLAAVLAHSGARLIRPLELQSILPGQTTCARPALRLLLGSISPRAPSPAGLEQAPTRGETPP